MTNTHLPIRQGKWKSALLMLSLLFTMHYTLCTSVKAQGKTESTNYKILLPGFNGGAGVPTSTNYKTKGTIGQTAPGLFSSTNYTVRSGFQYIHTIIPFSFSISNISIDFGTLTVGTPSTRTSTITIKAGGAGGYGLKAQENHPLAINNDPTKSTIIDTLCDSGPCSQTSAGPWTQNSTYGFGFNMDGDDIPSDFSGSKYRQFSDASLSEAAAVIMSKANVTWNYPTNTWPWESQATITYKVNVGPTQPAGNYLGITTFIAVPSF